VDVAGDVDDGLRVKGDELLEEGLIASLTRRLRKKREKIGQSESSASCSLIGFPQNFQI
jgi:hypothetical protein